MNTQSMHSEHIINFLGSPLMNNEYVCKKPSAKQYIAKKCWFCDTSCNSFVSICKYCTDKLRSRKRQQ